MNRSETRPAHYRMERMRELTPRQREVIALIAEGRTNPEIADVLGVSLDGAKWHVREIFARLGVDSREEAVATWREWNQPRARILRAARALIPATLPLRFATVAVAGAGSMAGAVALAVAIANGPWSSPNATPSSNGPVTTTVVLTPTPGASMLSMTRVCGEQDLALATDQRLAQGVVEISAKVTKPKDCDLTGSVDALLPRTAPSATAMMVGPAQGPFAAPAGTDTVSATIRWSNWCQDASTPGAMIVQVIGQDRTQGAPSTQVALTSAPGCVDPQAPPRLDVSVEVSPPPAPRPAFAQPASTATPPPAPVVSNPCVAGSLTTSSDTRRVNGSVVHTLMVSKPRSCDLSGVKEASAFDGDGDPNGQPLASGWELVSIPPGTDRATISVTWSNWCGATTQPFARLWLTFTKESSSGTSVVAYPDCIDPLRPTAFTFAVTTEPDPPASSAPAAGPALAVHSAADATTFARWFAAVVAARDLTAIEGVAQPLEVACPGTGATATPLAASLCKGAADGTVRRGLIMDQRGNTGTEPSLGANLARTVGAAAQPWSLGCANDAPACERFVVAFENTAGPGMYTGFVFESMDGTVKLRGLYPGGRGPGDPGVADAVNARDGGALATPWGPANFVPLRP